MTSDTPPANPDPWGPLRNYLPILAAAVLFAVVNHALTWLTGERQPIPAPTPVVITQQADGKLTAITVEPAK